MARFPRLCLLLLTATTTAACASGHSVKATGQTGTLAGKGSTVKSGPGGTVKIGNPYQVAGKWYYPADIPDYDEVGIASWYGPKFHGQRTANGEIFDMNEVSAAHPILPMPSYVEVTNLSNGRQLVVRINDRGPFVKDRVIDLSRRAAQLLGFDGTGTAPVRVRRVYPDGKGSIPPSLPQTVVASAETPATRPAPAQPAQPDGFVFIQVAALSDLARADTLALDLRRFGEPVVEPTGRGLFRVKIGPFDSPQAAENVLAKVRAAGYADAHVTLRPVS